MNINDLHISYGDNIIFNDFSLELESGKINVIMGGSGIGKTTLLNAIAGLVPYAGEIDIDKGRISYIFQNDRLIPEISVYKNLDLVLRAEIKGKDERKKRIEEMLSLLEIKELKDKLPTKLSGGERQRVAMARAYLVDSDILLMDEPFKALDTALKARLIAQLVKLNENSPKTVIFVTHAIDECLLAADSYAVLGGRPANIVASGRIEENKSERRLSDSYIADVRARLIDALFV